MIDFRLYRVAWIPAVAAFVAMMFSLEGVPEPPDPQISPTIFDEGRVRDNLKEILDAGPERQAGSAGDEAVADLVLERFEGVAAGIAATQEFEAEVGSEDTNLRNIVLTLPGESQRSILVLAGRDSASGPGAPSSAAATAALIELAETLGGAEHLKTLVFVSTSGSEGAAGARAFLDAYRERDLLEAAVVLSQPGFTDPRRPFVLRRSTDDSSTSMQLVRVAEEALAERTGQEAAGRSLFGSLARLAFPVATGEHSVLIAAGVDAVAISSAGERPLSASEGQEDDLSRGVLAEFGAAALGTILVLDPLGEPLQHGPDSYVEFSGSLIPGWSIAMFALALILPAAVAAVDGVARAARRRAGIVRATAWAFALAMPPMAALIAIHALDLVGLLATPAYPFDPGRYGVGVTEVVALLVVAGIGVGGFAGGRAGPSTPRVRTEAIAPALGTAATAGALAVWLLNPYLALLVAPAAHVWLLSGWERSRGSRPVLAAGAALALVPALLALRSSASAIGAGPWDLLLTVAAGQFSAWAIVAACPLAASLVGLLIAMRAPRLERTDFRDRENRMGAGPQAG